MGGTLGRFLSVTLCLLVGSVAAASQSEDPEALIHQGINLRKKGDDVRAEGYFRRAYELARTPRTAAQLGLVEMALSAYPEAEEYLSQALATPDAWVRSNTAVLQQTLGRVRAQLLRVEVAGAPPGATITTPARSAFKVPPDKTVWLPPGDTAIRIEAAGYSAAEMTVRGAAGEARQVTVKMSPEPDSRSMAMARTEASGRRPTSSAAPNEPEATDQRSSGASEPTQPGRGVRWGGVGIAAAGVVAAVVGGVVYAKGRSKRDAIQSPTQPYDPSDANWKTLQSTGLGLLIGGGVLVAGGLTMYFVGRQIGSASSASSNVSLSGGIGHGFGMLRCEGRF